MSAELERAVTVVREASDDLAGLTPDQIAAKLKKAGMLWCGPGEQKRSQSCPIHHWLEARLRAAGLLEYVVDLFVYREDVTAVVPTSDGRMGRCEVRTPAPVSEFIDQYDEGRYEHLEVPA